MSPRSHSAATGVLVCYVEAAVGLALVSFTGECAAQCSAFRSIRFGVGKFPGVPGVRAIRPENPASSEECSVGSACLHSRTCKICCSRACASCHAISLCASQELRCAWQRLTRLQVVLLNARQSQGDFSAPLPALHLLSVLATGTMDTLPTMADGDVDWDAMYHEAVTFLANKLEAKGADGMPKFADACEMLVEEFLTPEKKDEFATSLMELNQACETALEQPARAGVTHVPAPPAPQHMRRVGEALPLYRVFLWQMGFSEDAAIKGLEPSLPQHIKLWQAHRHTRTPATLVTYTVLARYKVHPTPATCCPSWSATSAAMGTKQRSTRCRSCSACSGQARAIPSATSALGCPWALPRPLLPC